MSENKNKNQKRDAMLFPFRWIESLDSVSDKDFRDMITSAVRYAKTGEKPNFSGFQLVAWQEFKNRIDADRERYEDICRKNQENIRKRWNTKNTTEYDRIRPDTKDTEGDNDSDLKEKERTLKSSKEKTEPFSLTDETPEKIPFTKWSEQQFRDEVAKFPEYEDIQEAFIDYWTEPTAKGKMRFQKETAWDTCRRLKTWKQRQQESSMFQTAEDRFYANDKELI